MGPDTLNPALVTTTGLIWPRSSLEDAPSTWGLRSDSWTPCVPGRQSCPCLSCFIWKGNRRVMALGLQSASSVCPGSECVPGSKCSHSNRASRGVASPFTGEEPDAQGASAPWTRSPGQTEWCWEPRTLDLRPLMPWCPRREFPHIFEWVLLIRRV